MRPLSRLCLDFAHELNFERIPSPTVEHMKQYVFDLIGCGIAGAARPTADRFLSYLEDAGGSPQAGIFGHPGRYPVEAAAMFNAAVSHVLEMDDSDRTAYSHPGIMVIPPALAIAEHSHSSGRDLLTACVAGYEIMLRLGAAAGPEHYKIWHTTGTTGVFGAAVAAGKLFRLSRAALGDAFGNAGTMAAGLWQFSQNHAMSKVLHAGRGVANGILAAGLARAGFTGADAILEGTQGFFAATVPGPVNEELFVDLGLFWRTDGVSFKPYPCCRHTHAAIDCGLALRRRLDKRTSEIREIRIETYDAARRVAGNSRPEGTAAAKFSLAYCVAGALRNGPLSERHFYPPYLDAPEQQRLVGLTTTEVSPFLEDKHPYHEGSRVTVKLEDGTILVEQIQDPLGDPERPLSWGDLEAKFAAITEGLFLPTAVPTLAETIRHLDEVEDWAAVSRSIARNCGITIA